MTQPNKPLEAKGCGCGFIIVVGAFVWFLQEVLSVNSDAAVWIAIIMAVVGVIVYQVNQYKAQKILDHDYQQTKTEILDTTFSTENRDEMECRFCGEIILAVAIKCKHCGSELKINDKRLINNACSHLGETGLYCTKCGERMS